VAEEAVRVRGRWPGLRLCLFGHTHVPAVHQLSGGGVRNLTPQARQALDDGGLWFVNPGSVDAARRGDGHAEFAVLDTGGFHIDFERVPYDHQRAEAEARAEGYRMGRVSGTLLAGRRLLRRARRKAGRMIRGRARAG
jgi:diadenosine tetraphosphatase ApaH/serine/threonine PP2A family protein phosphatase